MSNDRTLARFVIDRFLLRGEENQLEALAANIFAGKVVLAMRDDLLRDCVEYLAWGPEFRPVDEGEIIPLYFIQVIQSTDDEGKSSISDVRFIEEPVK